MNSNFETRIAIYSVILGVVFFIALYLAYRNRPSKDDKIANDDSETIN